MFKFFNKKIKKLNWFDFKVAGLYGAALGLLAATIWPALATISFWWYLGLAILFAGYMAIRIFRK